MNKHLHFASHADAVIRKCNSRLFVMRTFKCIGTDTVGLKMFYRLNIRPLMTYSSAAWFLPSV